MSELFRTVICLSFVGTCILSVVLLCQRLTSLDRTQYAFTSYLLAIAIFAIPLYPIKSDTEVIVRSIDDVVGLYIYDFLSNPYIIAAWLTGSLVYLIVFYVRYARASRNLKKGIRTAPGTIQRIFDYVCQNMGMAGSAALASSFNKHSPIVIGLLKPMILLPESLDVYDEHDIELIFKHELAHVRNRDNWIKLLANTVLAFHWFNPVAHLLLNQFVASCELRCDCNAVKGRSMETRQHYCEMLIHLAHGATSNNKYAVHYSFSQKERNFKKRIECIISDDGSRGKKHGRLMTAFLCAIMVSAAMPVLI